MATSESGSGINPAIAHLEPLIGEWRAVVQAGGSEVEAGSVSFKWLEGGAFIIQRSQAPAPYPSAVTVIGCDDSTGRCAAHYFDSRGVARLYEVSLSNGVWRQWREAPGFSQRYSGKFSEDGNTIDGGWELCRDGETWEHDFDLTYRRVQG